MIRCRKPCPVAVHAQAATLEFFLPFRHSPHWLTLFALLGSMLICFEYFREEKILIYLLLDNYVLLSDND
jgi:hypothetical protein